MLSIAVLIAVGYARFPSVHDEIVAIVTHLLFIHTWWGDTYGAINGVLWTLAVEVEFYALFPLIWIFFKRAPYWTALALVVESLLFRSHALGCCLHTNAPLLITNLPGYLDTFAAGMIDSYAYVAHREQLRTHAAKLGATLAAVAGFAFLAYLLHGLWMIRAESDWPTVWEIYNRSLIALAFAFMALGSLLAYPWWQRLIANPVLLFFAVISFNLYLYHQALARLLLVWHIPPPVANEHLDVHWQVTYTVIAFAATIVQATIVTYAFERPLLRIPLERWRALTARRRPDGALPPV